MSDRLTNGFWVIAGGILVLFASYASYGLSGHTSLYLRSVFTVPLAYSESKLGFFDVVSRMFGLALPSWSLIADDAAGTIRLLLWIGGAIGLVGLVLMSRMKDHAITAMWLLIFCAAVSFSTFLGGHAWGHYSSSRLPSSQSASHPYSLLRACLRW
jgi:hypothetical protein